MKPANQTKRLIILFVVFLIIMSAMTCRLVDLQLVNGEEYLKKSQRKVSSTFSVEAARGEILDRNGTLLVANSQVYKIRFIYAYWDRKQQNDVILRLCRVLEQNNCTYGDSLPISADKPFEYTQQSGTTDRNRLAKLFSDSKSLSEKAEQANNDASVAAALLCEYYDVDDSLSDAEKRKVIGIRYEMEQQGFSPYNVFTLDSDITIEAVSVIKERSFEFPGVEAVISAKREYRTNYAAHILGRVGAIFADEYEQLKDEGYPMNAVIGKDGVEKSFESELRGIDGKKRVETTTDGKVLKQTTISEPQPGNNCYLTIDIGLQQTAEQSLAENIQRIKKAGERGSKSGAKDIEGGAAVVIDVSNGEILALANYPTFNPATFSKDYSSLLANPLTPMVNRAIAGVYPPGSTFKMVTAIAALQEGIVTPETKINDTGVYEYYAPNYRPRCWYYKDYGRGHGKLNVSEAIKVSCNYFFYETGRLLGIERLNRYAKKLGLGQKTGIELAGEKAGVLAGPERREATGGEKWQPGETIQAAIGQSEQSFTPIQLAAYVATLVNGGTYYRPHLLKEVKTYDYKQTVYEKTAEVVSKIDMKYENYTAVMKGMLSVTEDGTASSVFRNFKVSVGGKTGSAQTKAGRSAHGVFVAFAPYENPQIAVCVIGEHAGSGNQMAWVARDIFEKYFTDKEAEQAAASAAQQSTQADQTQPN